ncbi:MAG: type VI secretion system ATPase TssH [Myxococcota bacterium]|nr:type VI secretion system ATPase TssH [Myxococcota bacterium]
MANLEGLIKRLSPTTRRTLEAAAGLAHNARHYEITPEHMLLACLDHTTTDIPSMLKNLGKDGGALQKLLRRHLEVLRKDNLDKPAFSEELVALLEDAWVVCSMTLGSDNLRTGAILVTLTKTPTKYADPAIDGPMHHLDWFGTLDASLVETRFDELTSNSSETDGGWSPDIDDDVDLIGDKGPLAGGALAKYATNFTQRARTGKVDPVFGRDREIRQMVDILARRRKNNPIIVGEAGVGKTALVEGLALRIAHKDVPDVLLNVELIGLDMGLLQAGASMKGEFENRLKDVINEVKNSPIPIILFIDEAHTLIGAGGQQGGSDAANLLKPALARGELRTLAATTWSEYKKYFEKDAALTRRFQLVKLDEPDIETATTMLRGLRTNYEDTHGVLIQDAAIVAAAELGTRYISGRQQPDKGIDLIDTAAARVRVALTSRPGEVEDAERRIQTLERELSALERDAEACAVPNEERIAELHHLIEKNQGEFERLTERWHTQLEAANEVVSARQALGETKEKIQALKNAPKPGQAVPAELDEDTVQLIEAYRRMPVDARQFLEGSLRAKGLDPARVLVDAEETNESVEPDYEGMMKEATNRLEKTITHLKFVQGREPMVNVEVTPEVVGQVVSDWTGIPLGRMISDEAGALLTMEAQLNQRIKGQDHALELVSARIRAAKAGLKSPETPGGVFLFVGPSGVGKTETALGVADLMFGGERFMTTINMSEFQEKHTVSRLIGSPPGYVGYGEGGVLTEAVRQRPYSVVLLDEVEKAHPEVLNLFYQVFDKGVLADGEGRIVDFKNTILFLTSNLASDVLMAHCPGDARPPLEPLISAIRPVLSDWFKPALLARMTIVPYYPISTNVMSDIVRLKLRKLQSRLIDTHKMTMELDDLVIDTVAADCTERETGARNVDAVINAQLMPILSNRILEQMALGPLPKTVRVGVDSEKQFTFEFSEPRSS